MAEKIKLEFPRGRPANETSFQRGDVLAYDSSPQEFMVVGEDDEFVWAFILGSGAPVGLGKTPENLGALRLVTEGSFEASFRRAS